jgi:hypothetical protein
MKTWVVVFGLAAALAAASTPSSAAPWDFRPGLQQDRRAPPRQLQRDRREARPVPQRDERPRQRLSDEERRDLRRDIDRANRELYRRNRQR